MGLNDICRHIFKIAIRRVSNFSTAALQYRHGQMSNMTANPMASVTIASSEQQYGDWKHKSKRSEKLIFTIYYKMSDNEGEKTVTEKTIKEGNALAHWKHI